jgi:parallel beta-helix repeat protein
MPVTLVQQRNPSFYANVKDFRAVGDGVNDDTTPITNAWNAIVANGGGVLYFPAGHYLTKDLLFQSGSNFVLKGERGAWIYSSPATSSSPGQATHDVVIVADCSDFTIDGLGIDGRRDTIAADQYLTANAASGQNHLTVQNGSAYFVGQALWLMGGLTANGGTEKTQNQSNLVITGISGNVLTVNSNLSNSYTGTGASGGAWVTQYQTGGVVSYTAAGRSLGNEDAQNGLHLLSCTRFTVRNCVAQNVWESPIKLGTGFASTVVTDGCSHGVITGNFSKHGYDQGVSVWNSQFITVSNNWAYDAGWAGVSFSHCSDCVATANICTNNVYTPAFDLNEGTGIAVEGGVRVTIDGNICSSNNSNGVRLNISPLFGGAALSQAVSGSLSAGATSITLTGSNSNFVNGASFTIVDPSNNQIRETIYCTGSSGATVSISPALRNSYASGATIYARFGEDVVISNNVCSLNALSAGIHADQQINLRVFANDCSKNGYSSGAFHDTQGTYGIHLHGFCQGAVVEANSCNFNAQEGMVIDNDNAAVTVQNNTCNNNGIKGTNQKMGIKLYGVVDSMIVGNECNFNTHSGIYTQDGNLHTARLTIKDNTCLYNNTSGIWFDNQGSTVSCIGNSIAYNGDTGIKVLGYKNSLFQNNKCYNQSGQEGIRFDDNGSNYCLDNRVFDNLLYDDQGSPSQSWGFRELGNSARTVLRGNRCFGNTNSAQISISATSRIAPDVALDSNTHDSTMIGAYSAAASSGDLQNASFNVWIDESGNNLKFQVKYSNGTVKNGSIALS